MLVCADVSRTVLAGLDSVVCLRTLHDGKTRLLCHCSVYSQMKLRLTYTVLVRHGRGVEYCNQFLCLSVCVSVCLSASISLKPLNRSSCKFVWLGLPLAALQCIMYFWFLLMTSPLAVMGSMAMHRSWTFNPLSLVELRYWGRDDCLWMPCFYYRATNAQYCCRNSVRPSVCLSVCLSICPSDACIVRKLNNALRIFWYHTKRQSL